MITGLPSTCTQGSVSGVAGDAVLGSRKPGRVSGAPQQEQGRGWNKQTAMPTPVQKNYTIYIYIYVQYINLFLLSPSNKHLPPPPQKKPSKLSVADPKTYNKRENKQSFSLSFSHCGIRYWYFKMKPKRKHANGGCQKCKHGGHHLCYMGCGWAGAGGEGGGGRGGIGEG